jgi:hypothetical protein
LEVPEDSIGLGAYNMDSHNSRRIVQDGLVRNEGDVEVGVKPYPVSYRSITPKAAECDNLWVPVCLSATHIAYGSIRMEPVFMILGQSAATAASLAIDAGATVQNVNYAQLKARLLGDHQILEWTGPAHHEPTPPPKLDGLVLDDTEGVKTGEWTSGTVNGTQRVGEGYIHDNNENKGQLSLRWAPEILEAGKYEIILHFPSNPNRATNIPVTVNIDGNTKTILVNEREKSDRQSLGEFTLPVGCKTTVTLSNKDTNGYVVADGIQFLRAGH